MVAAEQHGGHPVQGQQPAQRQAERGLHDPDFASRDVHRAQGAARLGRGSGGPEPVGAVAGDQSQVCQGLDVLHESRCPVHPAFTHRRALERGQGDVPGDVPGEGGGLAGQEALGNPHDPHGHRVATPREGRLQIRRPVLHRQVRLPRTGRRGDRLDAVQDQVGRQPQQRTVLVAGRFALAAVGDDDGGTAAAAARLGDREELAVHGERRSPAAGQAGGGDRAQERVRIAVRQGAVALLVGGEAGRGAAGGEQPG